MFSVIVSLVSSKSRIDTMFRRTNLRTSVVLILLAFLTIQNVEMSIARTLGLNSDDWSSTGEVSKRNSWWSKKSIASAPDNQDLIQDFTEYEENLLFLNCYVTECWLQFLQCDQGAATPNEFSECNKKQKTCSRLCLTQSVQDSNI